jgi:hypothetical protein
MILRLFTRQDKRKMSSSAILCALGDYRFRMNDLRDKTAGRKWQPLCPKYYFSTT